MTDADGVAAAQQFYGRWARVYDVVSRYTPGLSGVRSDVAAALDIAPGDTVVEMGCGTGANFPHLRERVGRDGRVIGVDFTRPMLERAQEFVDRERWENVHLLQGDAATLDICTDVDAVVATFVTGMLSSPTTVVDRWLDLLAPDGRLALLDASQSRRRHGWAVNRPFRALVVASAPGGGPKQYERPPWKILDRRVADARDALARRATVTTDSEYAYGTVRLTAARLS